MKHIFTNDFIKRGFGFGITSGSITTLGMMVGMYSSVGTRIAIIGGIVSIGIADAFADAFGMHISAEGDKHATHAQIQTTALSTFLFKLIFAFTFLIPIFLFSLPVAIPICILWGLGLITAYSVHLARLHKENMLWVIGEHLIMAIVVIAITYGVGMLVKTFFA